MSGEQPKDRIGIDLGGTKIEAIVMDGQGQISQTERMPTPKDSYDETLETISTIIDKLDVSDDLPIGIGTPGAVSLLTGLMKNCNSTFLNGMPLREDLAQKLGREVRIANDADCFTLSEASDGAAKDSTSVFGVILGTGVGGGVCIDQKLVSGISAICGEWGHNTLALNAYQGDHLPKPARECYCDRIDCVETWLAGPALQRSYRDETGADLPAQEIVSRAKAGESAAQQVLDQYHNLLALGLSVVINILDPHTIVLGGGMSNTKSIYSEVGKHLDRYVFSDQVNNKIVPAMHGDSSGVRGAAWLW